MKWKGPFWARRYSAIVVSDEEKAQVDRLRYILAHSPKENLVERVLDWPGVHAARAILEDKPLTGYWFDRTQEYAVARNRGEEYGRLTYATEETFFLTRLPCWEHLSQDEYRQRVAELVEEIELDARVARMERGLPVLGAGAVLRQHPIPSRTRPRSRRRRASTRRARRSGTGSERRIWSLPGRLPRCGRAAQGRRPLGEIPGRLVPTRPAVRESPAAIGGERLTRPSARSRQRPP